MKEQQAGHPQTTRRCPNIQYQPPHMMTTDKTADTTIVAVDDAPQVNTL